MSKYTDKFEDAEVTTIKWKKVIKKLYACASLKCIGFIENIKYEILIDSVAELCFMSKEVFDEVGLPIDYNIKPPPLNSCPFRGLAQPYSASITFIFS